MNFVDADHLANGLGGGFGIAGQHDHPDAGLVQRPDRLFRAGLDRVGDTDQTRRLAIDRDEHHRLALRPAILRLCRQRGAGRAEPCHQLFIADRDPLVFNPCLHAFAGNRLEIARGRNRQAPVFRAGDNGGGQRMFAGPFDRGDPCEQLIAVQAAFRLDRDQLWLALGQRPGLVDHDGVDFFEGFERLGILDQDSVLRPLASADHDRHRSGETQRTGTGDDQHRDGVDQPIGERRLRSPQRPDHEGYQSDQHHGGYEEACHRVGEFLDRRAAALGIRDHLDDFRQQRVLADALGGHDEAARLVDGTAGDVVALGFLDRDRLAGDHRLVNRARTLDDGPVNRDFLARPDPQPVARLDLVERNFFVRTVRVDSRRNRWSQFEQRAQGAGGLAARLEFQHLSEQYQGRDHGSGFIIDGDIAVMAAKRRRKGTGEEGRHHAEPVSDGDAQPDQGEHVEIHAFQRLHATHEKGPGTPENDRRGQQQLDPGRDRRVQPGFERPAGNHVPHGIEEQRQRKDRADPEAPAHIEIFGVGAAVEREGFRLQRHSADRAGTGPLLPDFRMHWTGVDRACRDGFPGGRGVGRKIMVGIGDKFCPAAGGAEMVILISVMHVIFGRAGIDRHAADRILDRRFAIGVVRGSGLGHLKILFDCHPYTLWGYI